jgi:uncharacterized DUF497 family protein
MPEVLFEWDEAKNLANIKKHGISFQEAKTCFEDEYAEIFSDPEHSENEDRYIFLGLSAFLKTLVVVYTERCNDNEQIINRIISARKATKKEFLYYWENRKQKGSA